MSRKVLLNILYNVILTAIFVFLNQWALQNQLEETFITLAVFYGVLVIVGNALFFLPRNVHI